METIRGTQRYNVHARRTEKKHRASSSAQESAMSIPGRNCGALATWFIQSDMRRTITAPCKA